MRAGSELNSALPRRAWQSQPNSSGGKCEHVRTGIAELTVQLETRVHAWLQASRIEKSFVNDHAACSVLVMCSTLAGAYIYTH